MMYAHPEVLTDQRDRTCAQALAALAPAAEDVARAAAEGRRMKPLELTCPVENCGAVFVLRALSLAETARLRGGPTPPRGVTTRRTARRRKGRLRKWIVVVLAVTLLAGGGLAGLVFLAPELLPAALTRQLKAWKIPIPDKGPPPSTGGIRQTEPE